MPRHFKSDPKTISDLFGGADKPKLIVPEFQRGYSWKRRHVEEFWRDLMCFLEDKANHKSTKYFLGPIVILERDGKPSEILDGQQRLATATILLAAMRDVAREIGGDDLSKLGTLIHTTFIIKDDVGDDKGNTLTLSKLDKVYFEETVQALSPDNSQKPKIASHTNIQKARAFLQSRVRDIVNGLKYPEKVAWLKRLRDVVRSDLIMTYIPVDDEKEAFQIFETLNDRGLRLSVPDLLLNHLMKIADDSDREELRGKWDRMLEIMGQRKTSDFLRAVWVSEFGDLKKKDLFAALKERLNSDGKHGLKYARRCEELAHKYISLLEFNEKAIGPAAKHIRILLRSLGGGSAIPLLLAATNSLSKDGVSKLAKWLVVFVVRFSVITGLDSGVQEDLFFRLAREVSARMEKGKESECLEYVKGELTKECPSNEKLEASISELYLSPEEGPYFMSTIANKMQSDRKEIAVNEVDVEHIFPQGEASKWKNADEMRPYIWHIGNLMVISDDLNNACGNKPFEEKREIYKKSQVVMANKVAEHYQKWNPKSVEKRAAFLGKLINEIWDLKNTSRV